MSAVSMMSLMPSGMHLDCMFAVVREGLCMCFMQGLKEGQLPKPIKDWEIIEATAEEAHSLGCNTLCLLSVVTHFASNRVSSLSLRSTNGSSGK